LAPDQGGSGANLRRVGTLPLIANLQRTAVACLPPEVSGYVDAGAGARITAGEATAAWDAYRFRPRILRDVGNVDAATSVAGSALANPILVAPTGYHRLVHDGGEAEMARGVAAGGGLFVLSTRTTVRIEDVAAVAGAWWFQVYVMRDRHLTAALVQRAAKAGATALVLTGDTPYVGRKPSLAGGVPPGAAAQLVNLADHLAPGTDIDVATAQDPTVGLSAVAWLRQLSGLPVLVKGVLRADDARACLDAGAAGVIVSNHGGRQLDRAISTASVLPEIVTAVAGRGEVLVDGGLRDGPSIMTALALGAGAVLVGRPALWALASGGAIAVQQLLAALDDDLRHAMALAGAATIADLDPSLLAPAMPRQ
jgi:4-hydroxymandelate oxidase